MICCMSSLESTIWSLSMQPDPMPYTDQRTNIYKQIRLLPWIGSRVFSWDELVGADLQVKSHQVGNI